MVSGHVENPDRAQADEQRIEPFPPPSSLGSTIESAPLLNDEDQSHHPIFRSSRSLTALEKILAGVAILLLLIASTFIGLFAGTNHQLSKERHRQPVIVTTTVGGPPATKTINPTGQKPFPAPTIIPTPGPGKGEKKVCLTKDCVLLAGEILNSLDESVDPCVDFYGFASEFVGDPSGLSFGSAC